MPSGSRVVPKSTATSRGTQAKGPLPKGPDTLGATLGWGVEFPRGREGICKQVGSWFGDLDVRGKTALQAA